MSKVDRDLVRAYQRRVSRERKDTPGGKQPHSLATRQRRLVAVRSFLRFASLEEWTTRDLAAAIDLPKLPQRLPKPLEDADRERLVHDLPATTVQEKRDRALVFLLLSTGARISEILRLNRRGWALERLTVVGKGDKERVVTVTARARDTVDDCLAARSDPSPALFIAFHPGARSDETARRANRLTARGARYICTQIAGDLGIAGPPPASTAPYPRNPPAGAAGRRAPHRGDARSRRPRIGRRIHQDHRSAPTRGEGHHRGRRPLTTSVDHHPGCLSLADLDPR